MTRAVVSLNSGSSSIKFGLYELDPNGAPVLAVRGKIERIGISPRLPSAIPPVVSCWNRNGRVKPA